MEALPFAAMLEAERRAREALSAEPSQDGIRAWWAAASAVLVRYAEGREWTRPGAPAPAELALIVGRIAAELAVGRIPDVVADVAGAGSKGLALLESRDIAWAIAYRQACAPEGLSRGGKLVRLVDRAPVATLADWFGVSRRTVQGWCARGQMELPPGPLTTKIVRHYTQQAGARYQNAGRSSSAIRQRAPKG
jgi:hypothetical protein